MPAALDVNWEAVRTLAVQIGVREAARQCGIEENAVCQRSWREGWLKNLPRSESLPPTMLPQPVSGIIKPHDVLTNLGQETRVNHAIAANKISGKVAQMEADEALNRVPDILAAAKHAAVVHGWSGAQVNVGIRLDQIAQSAAVSVDLPENVEITE